MIVVLGASGNTGEVVASNHLARGQKVRVVARRAEHLQSLAQRGAEVFTADATDATALTNAFRGAEAAYVMIPPNVTTDDVLGFQDQVSEAITAAVRNSGIKHVVALSSMGADKPSGTGPVLGLHKLEQKLNAVNGINVLFFFFQAEDGIRVLTVTGVQTCALPIYIDYRLSVDDIGIAVVQQIGGGQAVIDVVDAPVVDVYPTLAHGLAGVALGVERAGDDERVHQRQLTELAPAQLTRGCVAEHVEQRGFVELGDGFGEKHVSSAGGAVRLRVAMDERGDLARQDSLRIAALGMLGRGDVELLDALTGQEREPAKAHTDVGVLGPHPVLEELVGARAARVEPHPGAGLGLAHLGPF